MAAPPKAIEGDNRYGLLDVEETPDLIKDKLAEMETELGKLKDEDKQWYNNALEKCPELVTDAAKLKFLRSMQFNATFAAMRLAHYWKIRVELFGEELAYKPLTLKEGMKNDMVALNRGFLRLLPTRDADGRAIIFGDHSLQDKSLYTRESMIRCNWYVMHAAIEDEEVQKKGVVVIFFPKNAKMSQVDNGLMQKNTEVMATAMPMRLMCMHVCQPPMFFSVVFPFLQMIMGDYLKKHMKVHKGKDAEVLAKLEEFGLTKDVLPTEIGGDITLDHDAWIAQRTEAGL